jgi:hypothetical protein
MSFDGLPHTGAYQLQEDESWNLIVSAHLSKEAVSGRVLAGLASRHPEIVVMTADLKYSNRLSDFAEEWPERFFNFGIAEQNMVSAAAGMATTGKMPFIGTFAAFIALLGASTSEPILPTTTFPSEFWPITPELQWAITAPTITPSKTYRSSERWPI